ncbi:hypothetical protein ACHQM5_011414 [Ranunculus cassubicifolius]
MAATLHAKMNRKKLNKLNLIRICEEILNPSVPMALRLSSILMGGVVIVYERKVKLLLDDVTRLLVEINEAWKVKIPTSSDRTLLPKSKSQAKYKSVTLPAIDDGDPTAIDPSLNFTVTNSGMGGFQHQPGEYITMQLDQVNVGFINKENQGNDMFQDFHQADPANITLMDTYDSHQIDTSIFDRFERFDIEGDDETQMNYTTQNYSLMPEHVHPLSPVEVARKEMPDHIHSSPPEEFAPQEMPPPQLVSPENDEVQDLPPDPQSKSDEQREEAREVEENAKPRATKRRVRQRANNLEMDYEQTIISGDIYQSWLQNPDDLISARGSRKQHLKPTSLIKTAHLMELPPSALLNGVSGYGKTEVYYPKRLLDQYMGLTPHPPRKPSSSRSSGNSPPEPAAPPSPPPLNQDSHDFPIEEFHTGVRTRSKQLPIEKQMESLRVDSQPKQLSVEKLMENLRVDSQPNIFEFATHTPGNSGGSNDKSAPSFGSGNVQPLPTEPLERSSRKRTISSSRHSTGSGLDPVTEEGPQDLAEPNLKLRRLSENGIFSEHETAEMLMETGPTQTPLPVVDQPFDKMTDAVRKHLKTHFDTPGTSEYESLDNLTSGMNAKRASLLFLQTLVLASHDILKVQQDVPYGDILISKGRKM